MKKQFTLFFISLVLSLPGFSQVGIGTLTPDASSILDVTSTTKGLLIPRMTTTERGNISPATDGLMVYDITTHSFWFYKTGTWNEVIYSDGSGSSPSWLITGNSGTGSTNFLGTTDNVPLRFKVNNTLAGFIEPTNNNTSYGYQALASFTSGMENVALGYRALNSNTTGYYNTAIGYNTLNSGGVGINNTAVGHDALDNNTGSGNTAIGAIALQSATGNNNTSTGYKSLLNDIEGASNTAIGASALTTNISGNYNVALGSGAGYYTTGSGNVFLGFQAGQNETGSNKLYISNDNSTKPLLLGDFSTSPKKMTVFGQLGIGINTVNVFTPSVPLHIAIDAADEQDMIRLNRQWEVLPVVSKSNISFYSEINAHVLKEFGRITFDVTDITASNNNGNLRFWTRYKDAITNTVSIMGNGFVGIGTDNPQNTLHVSAKADPLRLDGLKTTSEENVLVADSRGVVSTRLMSSLDVGAWSLTGNGTINPSTNFLGTTVAEPLILKTNNSEAMRISSTGKMGIGTTNETEKVNINGNILFTNDNTISTISIDGVSPDGTPGRHLKISAGPHGSVLGTSGNLYLDGGSNPGDNQGNVLIASDNPGLVGVWTDSPNSVFQVNGSFATTVVSKSADYSLGTNDQIIICTADMIATLPSAIGIAGRQYTIKRTYTSGSGTTVSTSSSQTIDGATTYSLSDQWKYITVVSDGSNWFIIANN